MTGSQSGNKGFFLLKREEEQCELAIAVFPLGSQGRKRKNESIPLLNSILFPLELPGLELMGENQGTGKIKGEEVLNYSAQRTIASQTMYSQDFTNSYLSTAFNFILEQSHVLSVSYSKSN